MISESELTALVLSYLPYIILVMTVLILLALLVFISINIKLAKMNRRYRKMMQGMDDVNLEALLLKHIEEVRTTTEKVNRLTEDTQHLSMLFRNCVQNVGVIRFNAFEDTGSDLSYAVALLDAKKNGIVFSGIYGRNESRVYAKPIQNCESTYFLTDEEKAAISKAFEKK
ncbi:MAG TPA: DUF4446 family protein [Patescibacteria group bacterium]|nr:DUF4446 family protein [Patescibacteria group bacterium]